MFPESILSDSTSSATASPVSDQGPPTPGWETTTGQAPEGVDNLQAPALLSGLKSRFNLGPGARRVRVQTGTLSKAAWATVPDRVRTARHEAAQAEWDRLVASGDPHAAAMWLQAQGYRLRDLEAAHATWRALVQSQT